MEPKKNPSKDVHRYSKQFFLIGLCISTFITICAFEWKNSLESSNDAPHEFKDPVTLYYDDPVLHLPLSKPVAPEKKLKITNPENLEVDKNSSLPEDPELIQIEPVFTDIGVIPVDIPIETKTDTFLIVEKMPVPIGGYSEFYKQIGKSIHYPKQAQRANTEGKVLVEFVINNAGEPTNFRIINGIGSGCDEEAIRVLRLSRWEPGKQRGRAVHVKMVLPIYFMLN